ncbi:MAG: hypothetical protein P8J25_03745 [Porticoccaceae bacterium]|nr:hypothetical protein [Porticoccaceae bacterium]
MVHKLKESNEGSKVLLRSADMCKFTSPFCTGSKARNPLLPLLARTTAIAGGQRLALRPYFSV